MPLLGVSASSTTVPATHSEAGEPMRQTARHRGTDRRAWDAVSRLKTACPAVCPRVSVCIGYLTAGSVDLTVWGLLPLVGWNDGRFRSDSRET